MNALRYSLPVLAVLVTARAEAHPMGNFSVNHYAKLVVTKTQVEVTYALDLAEIPTFELLRDWNLNHNSPGRELNARAEAQTREWLKHLTITINNKPVTPALTQTSLFIADGAGNLPILRITAHVTAPANIRSGIATLGYEDRNYPDRAGWKEIVIAAAPGVNLQRASQSNADISDALTHYPPDPTVAPPQDLRAEVTWRVHTLLPAVSKPAPVVRPIAQPKIAPAASAPALMTRQSAPAGTVVRGDFLSRVLHRRELTTWMLLAALGAAFLLGAAHALTPGHGKTIVAAYLVGSRGTLGHAVFLGAMVTFTHTIAVFILGLATLFLFRYVVPEKITVALGAVSGLSIVAVGAWMLWKRIHRNPAAHTHHHHHHHDHDHTHHHHDHHHDHDHGHPHSHPHSHSHTHSHVPERISWGALVTLGVSGGLVPCESALILLLGAIALGRVGFGLLLLTSFSLGLALVLMAIGVLVLFAKNLIPEGKRQSDSGFLRWASIASPAVVIIVGAVMTAVSLGWLGPRWTI